MISNGHVNPQPPPERLEAYNLTQERRSYYQHLKLAAISLNEIILYRSFFAPITSVLFNSLIGPVNSSNHYEILFNLPWKALSNAINDSCSLQCTCWSIWVYYFRSLSEFYQLLSLPTLLVQPQTLCPLLPQKSSPKVGSATHDRVSYYLSGHLYWYLSSVPSQPRLKESTTLYSTGDLYSEPAFGSWLSSFNIWYRKKLSPSPGSSVIANSD